MDELDNIININKISNEKENTKIDLNDIKISLKEKVNKYFDEYNISIYKYYYLRTINKISELIKENILLNKKINDEYQNNIKELLKMQINGNDKITDEDIDSLKEEQELEIQKNNDLNEKNIEEELTNFKLFGYSHLSPKEMEILKNKIKCEIYNYIYNILDSN